MEDATVDTRGLPGKKGTSQKWNEYYEYLRRVDGREEPKKESQGKNSDLQEKVGSFAESFTAHGFGRIYGSAHWFRRVIWVLVCVILLAVGTYQCYRVLVEYLSYPKKVTIGVEEDSTVEFPAVTVCNLNPLATKEDLSSHPVWGTFIEIEGYYSDLDCGLEFRDIEYDYLEEAYDYDYSSGDYSGDSYWDPGEEWSPDWEDDYSQSSGEASTQASEEYERRRRRDTFRPPSEEQPEGRPVSKPRSLKREKPRRNILVKENKFSKRDRSKKYEEIRRLGVENVLPKPDSEREAFLDFDQFTERNKHLFLEDRNPSPQHRMKREDTNEKKEPEKITKAEVDALRTKCSKYYRYLKYIKMDESTERESSTKINFEKSDDCPIADFKEDVSYNPLCQLEVFCDKFGCYDYNLEKYKETRLSEPNGDVYRCPACADVCWEAADFKSWSNGSLSYSLVLSILNSSRTPDLSDVLGLYQPSDEDLKSYSIAPKDFIQTCSFDRQPCSHKQFHSWISDQYGVCHTFNSAFRKITLKKNGKTIDAIPRKTTSVGPKSGIRLTISIKARNYMTLLSPDMGAKVIVHSPRHIPFPEDEGFNVSPGVSVSVSVSTKRIERVSHPWGNCKNKTESDVFKEYSAIRCKKLCQEEEIWKSCGCYLGRSPAYDSYYDRPENKCSPFNITEKLCMETVRFAYQNGLLKCDCPPACHDTVYNTKVTTSEDNTKFYTIVQNIKQANMGDDLCLGTKNETVRLHVYLESLTYEIIQESPAYTWDTLVCNIGGNLGLFIGMSLVTMVEVFEFLLDLGLLCFGSRRRTKPETQLVEVKATKGQLAPPVGSEGPVAPAEVADSSTQTAVTLQPFCRDSTWKHRAMGKKPGMNQAFNRVFLS